MLVACVLPGVAVWVAVRWKAPLGGVCVGRMIAGDSRWLEVRCSCGGWTKALGWLAMLRESWGAAVCSGGGDGNARVGKRGGVAEAGVPRRTGRKPVSRAGLVEAWLAVVVGGGRPAGYVAELARPED